VSLAVAFPHIHAFTNWRPEWREQALEWQLRHPLSAIPAERFFKPGPEALGDLEHLRKRSYRVTLPLIAYGLGLDLRETAVLSALSSIAFVVVMLLYFRKLSPEDPAIALLFGVAAGCSLVGQWGSYVYFYFDGFSYLLLALSAYTRKPLLIAIVLAAGGLSDERVVLASPLIYLLHSRSFPADPSLKALLRPNRQQYGVIGGTIVFAAARVLLGMHIGRPFDSAMVGFESVKYNLTLLPLAWPLVFKGATLVMAAGSLCLLEGRSAKAALLLLICVAPVIISSLLVWDLCRSLGYAFPVLLLCAKGLLQSSSPQSIRRVAISGALISACLPTYYLWGNSIRFLVPVLRVLMPSDWGT
jgi:hypothetical protein